MKILATPKGDVNEYFANYRNGKSSTERSGITWKALSELEKKVPELTCKTGPYYQKQA